MSDALGASIKQDREDTAWENYAIALIIYLDDQTRENRKLLETSITAYAELSKRSNEGLKNHVAVMLNNDLKEWRIFQRIADQNLLFDKEEGVYKQRFLAAAQKRGVGSMQWVV